MQILLNELELHTVCEEAKCPNIGECFKKETATFLILGNICTRNCSFCAINKGKPLPPDPEEPGHIARATKKLGLSHTVITSVTRDDLPNGGAEQFAATVKEIRKINPETTIEILIPDFNGSKEGLEKVIEIQPEVINHNVETVPRLYPRVRPKADYIRSLNLLKEIKETELSIITKSGFMVGLGETKSEIFEVMEDMRTQNVDVLTIGQYLCPSGKQLPVADYIHPDQFLEYKEKGNELGFKFVAANPYTRSSYKAQEALLACKNEP